MSLILSISNLVQISPNNTRVYVYKKISTGVLVVYICICLCYCLRLPVIVLPHSGWNSNSTVLALRWFLLIDWWYYFYKYLMVSSSFFQLNPLARIRDIRDIIFHSRVSTPLLALLAGTSGWSPYCFRGWFRAAIETLTTAIIRDIHKEYCY